MADKTDQQIATEIMNILDLAFNMLPTTVPALEARSIVALQLVDYVKEACDEAVSQAEVAKNG